MTIVREILKAIDVQYKKFYQGKGGLPRFQSFRDARDSFPLVADTFRIRDGQIHVAGITNSRKGECMALHRRGGNPCETGKAVSGQIKKEIGKWYAYIVYRMEGVQVAPLHDDRVVGIDRNTAGKTSDKRQIALSDGNYFSLPESARCKLDKLDGKKKFLQRKLSKQDKGSRKDKTPPSGRYRDTQRRLQNVEAQIANIRKQFAHETTASIASKYDCAVLEDLNTKGMTASAKGNSDKPSRQIKQKSGLNRAILESGWGDIEWQLSYKLPHGTVKVPAPYTSQACSQCGHISKENRKTQADFHCQACGHRDNADTNAAKNIRMASVAEASARGGTVAVMTACEA